MNLTIRRTLLLGALLLLPACGGEDTTTACAYSYWDGTVGTCLPDGWHVLDREMLDEFGVSEEVIIAFQSDVAYAGQYVTVTVLEEPLTSEMTSEEYSDASTLIVQTLPGYEEVDQSSVDVDGAEVTLHVYTAQPQEDKPAARFYQVSAVHDGIGYSFTAATPVSAENALDEQVRAILENATFSDPSAAE